MGIFSKIRSKVKRTPKKIRKKKPVFTPTKADDRGFKEGGSIESFQDQVKRKYGGGKL